MFNNFDMEAIHDLFQILRNFKLIGLSMKETEYKKEEIANLGEMIIELADKGTNALMSPIDSGLPASQAGQGPQARGPGGGQSPIILFDYLVATGIM